MYETGRDGPAIKTLLPRPDPPFKLVPTTNTGIETSPMHPQRRRDYELVGSGCRLFHADSVDRSLAFDVGSESLHIVGCACCN